MKYKKDYELALEELSKRLREARNAMLYAKREYNVDGELTKMLLCKSSAKLMLICEKRVKEGRIHFIPNILVSWKNAMGESDPTHVRLLNLAISAAANLVYLKSKIGDTALFLHGTVDKGRDGKMITVKDYDINNLNDAIKKAINKNPGFVPYALTLYGEYFRVEYDFCQGWHKVKPV